VGEAEDLAMPELEYPHFEWTSRLKAFKRDGREVTITPEETPTARFSADVQFTPMRIEVWGPQGFHRCRATTKRRCCEPMAGSRTSSCPARRRWSHPPQSPRTENRRTRAPSVLSR
jgi:hypothetical protein